MIIPVDYAQANIRFTGTGMPNGGEITLGLNVELYAGTAEDLADDVLTIFQSTAIRAQMSSVVNIDSCYVKYGPNDIGQSAEVANPLAGTAASTGTSPQVAYLVKKVTGFGGRSGQGRFYLPGVPEGSVDPAGQILSAGVTALNTALEAARAALVSAGAIPTLLHGGTGPISAPLPIVGFQVDSRCATQRRRNRR